MTKDKLIDYLWERSNHGTRREDVMAAYNAGVEAEREACALLAENFKWWEVDGCSPDESNIFIAKEIRDRT